MPRELFAVSVVKERFEALAPLSKKCMQVLLKTALHTGRTNHPNLAPRVPATTGWKALGNMF